MGAKLTDEEALARRASILDAARWCFLNFGFGKTSLDDIARRAGISRTLLYRIFKDKEDIFTEVFSHWHVARHPEVVAAANGPGCAYDRLLKVCKIVAIDPWAEMAGAPMADNFLEVCERLNPEVSRQHRDFVLKRFSDILNDEAAAEVFLLALDGLYEDDPSVNVLEDRVRILAVRFAPVEAWSQGPLPDDGRAAKS